MPLRLKMTSCHIHQTAGIPVVFLVITLLLSGTAAAEYPTTSNQYPELIQYHWGFGERLISGSFTPLAIQVRNPRTDKTLEGTFTLSSPSEQTSSARFEILKSVSLQPGEIAWVRFIPYNVDSGQTWELQWNGEGTESLTSLTVPSAEGPAVVLLESDAAYSRSGGHLAGMPAGAFPESVTAFEGLSVLLLAESPDWNDQQAQALLDWIKLGGRVIVLQSEEGNFPSFSGRLSLLNQINVSGRLRSGTITKVAKTASTLDSATLAELISLPRQEANGIGLKNERTFAMRHIYFDRDRWLFDELAKQAAFQRNWFAISIAVIFYLIALFPCCYYVGHHQRHVPRFYLCFAGVILIFSFVFGALGQLGASTQNQSATAVVARSIEPGRMEVHQWTQLASVRGGTEQIRLNGSGVCFGAPKERETPIRQLELSEGGEVEVHLLPAALGAVVNRSVSTFTRPEPSISSFSNDGTLIDRLVISTETCFEQPVLSGVAVWNGTVHHLTVDGNSVTLDPTKSPEELMSFLGLKTGPHMSLRRPDWSTNRNPHDEKAKTQTRSQGGFGRDSAFIPAMLGYSIEVMPPLSQQNWTFPDQTLRLALVTELPESLRNQNPRFPDQIGTVLWVYDLPVK